MKKEKTIIVTACDLCGSDNKATYPCSFCLRDACTECVREYELSSRPVVPKTTNLIELSNIFGGHNQVELRLLTCTECRAYKLTAFFEKFGFKLKQAAA